MEDIINHSVLIVDDETLVVKTIERLLKTIKVKSAHASNGGDGLAIIKKTPKPFSIIISDQRMPGMTGYEFLEKVKEISPDTIRFLITGYSNMDAIMDAVNKGAIHRYIAKPWDAKDFLETIKAGLKKYELFFENNHLLKLAKENNAKLYSRNCELRQRIEKHKKNMAILDSKIKELNLKIEKTQKNEAVQDLRSGKKAEQLIKDRGWMNPDKIRLLYIETVKEFFEQFHEVAARNGIEMPDSI